MTAAQDDARGNDRADDVASGDDDRYVPHAGPASDPYDDQPENRRAMLAPLLAEHGGLTADERLDFVLSLPNAKAVVQALPADEFVLWAKDIGPADCGELLALGSPRQMQACLDLDAWRYDDLDTSSVFGWLALAQEHSSETAELFVGAQEDGLLCLALAQHIKAIPVHAEVDNELPDDAEIWDSPDGSFKLVAQLDDPALPWVRRMVEVLFGLDMLRARAVIKGLYWELPAQLDDDLRDLRAARMRDLGFEPQAAAQRLYAYRDPHAWKRELLLHLTGSGGAVVGAHPYVGQAFDAKLGLALHDATMPPLLTQALTRLDGNDKDRVQIALLRLTYRVQSARAVAPSAVDELAGWAKHALQTAAMGLQFASDGDVALAAVVLRSVLIEDLFTAAHSLVVIAAHRVRRLRQTLNGRLDVLGEAQAALCQGLLAKFPGTPHPVASMAELQQLQAQLTECEGLVSLMGPTGGVALAIPEGATLSTLLATALAWRALGQPPSVHPLDLPALRALCAACFVHGQWRPEVRATLLQGLTGATELAVTRAMQGMADDLARLDPAGELDLRFVGDAVLLVR